MTAHRRLFRKNARAFSLVEILFVVVVLGVAISTILVALTGQLSHVKSSSKDLQAASIASEAVDAAKSIRDASWSDLAVGTHGLAYANGVWSFSGSSDVQNGFTRTVTVSDIDTNKRKVSVNIAWKGTNGQNRSYGYSTILANWRNLDSTPAGGTLTGDWHNPVFIGNMLDFGDGFRGIAEDVGGNYLYVAGYGTLTSSNELVVVDVTNPLIPVFRGSINTGVGVNKVAVDQTRKLTYLANANTTNQLQIVDVSNPDSLKLKKQFGISGNNHTGRSIALMGNTVYLGTEGPATAEFYIIDVTNSLSPVVKGSLAVGNDINDIAVYGNYAYIGSDVDAHAIGIINISNPASPSVTAWINLPGSATVEDLFYDPTTKHLYAARKSSPDPNTPEVVIIDVSNPSSPQIVGQLDYDVDLDSIYAEGNLMIVTALGDIEFKEYNVANLPAIVYYGGIDFGTTQTPTDIVYSNNVFYITIWERYALRIISAF